MYSWGVLWSVTLNWTELNCIFCALEPLHDPNRRWMGIRGSKNKGSRTPIGLPNTVFPLCYILSPGLTSAGWSTQWGSWSPLTGLDKTAPRSLQEEREGKSGVWSRGSPQRDLLTWTNAAWHSPIHWSALGHPVGWGQLRSLSARQSLTANQSKEVPQPCSLACLLACSDTSRVKSLTLTLHVCAFC